MNIDVDRVCAIARAAGAAIMDIYDGDHGVEFKDDKSPLTAADKAAHRVIVAGLEELTPDIPILSEEGRDIPYDLRKKWSCFWLVDPLDGTKEFIKRNGEFTVNIALIEVRKPVFGVVYVPVQDTLYWGGQEQGAWCQKGQGPAKTIRVRVADSAKGLTVVMSRSHPSPELEEYLKTIHVADAVSVGSSLKLCTVAEGRADLYPRLGPTMEWDTGAGHAIVLAAGGTLTTQEGSAFIYNKEELLNPYFFVKGVSRICGSCE